VIADTLTKQIAEWRRDRMALRSSLIMPDGRRFGDVMAPFQRQDFAALDSRQRQHAYLERGRGGSKTHDVAAEAVCELFLGPPGGRLYAAAVDRDQAALLHEAAAGWVRRTPLLAASVEVEKWRIIVPATDNVLSMLSADAPSAWGLAPTWFAEDEFANQPEGYGEEMWQALWTALPKRRGRCVVITTPGWDRTSLCWRVREMALKSPDWYVSIQAGPAPWLDPAWLQQMRASTPDHVYARLFDCRWVENVGAFLSVAEVDGLFTSDLPAGSGPTAIGLDLGLTRDSSVIAVVRRDYTTDSILVEHLETWKPASGLPIDLQAVEDSVAVLARKFAGPIIIDPWQTALLSQRLQARGLRVTEFPFTTENRRRLFGVVLDLVRNKRLRSRPHENLRRELLSLEVTETASGWRVDHRVGRHDDHVVAVGLAAKAVTGEAASHRPAAGAFVPRHIRETLRDRGAVGRSEF
jgi:hypothetical protein